MKKTYVKPNIQIESLLPDIEMMSDISKEMYDFYRNQFEITCRDWGMEANDANWEAYKATLDVSIPYCYHTANILS